MPQAMAKIHITGPKRDLEKCAAGLVVDNIIYADMGMGTDTDLGYKRKKKKMAWFGVSYL